MEITVFKNNDYEDEKKIAKSNDGYEYYVTVRHDLKTGLSYVLLDDEFAKYSGFTDRKDLIQECNLDEYEKYEMLVVPTEKTEIIVLDKEFISPNKE